MSKRFYPENIPQSLKALSHGLLWRSKTRDGKPTKVPYDAKTKRYGKSNDPLAHGPASRL
jgi:primase-polymerase (primpol)-like protein